MDNCYNMTTTSMNHIENLMIKTYNESIHVILSTLGFGGLFIGAFNLLYNEY